MIKKLKSSAAAKFIAVILAGITFLSAAIFGSLFVYMLAKGYYTSTYDEVRADLISDIATGKARSIANIAANDNRNDSLSYDPDTYYMPDKENIQFVIYLDGSILFDSFEYNNASVNDYDSHAYWATVVDRYYGSYYDPDFDYDYGWTETDADEDTTCLPPEETDPVEETSPEESAPVTEAIPDSDPVTESAGRAADTTADINYNTGEFTVSVAVFVRKTFAHTDGFSTAVELSRTAYDIRYKAIGFAIMSAILTVVFYVFAVSAAGHRSGVEGISLSMFDRTPLDLLLLIIAGIAALEITILAAIFEFFDRQFNFHSYYSFIEYDHALGVFCAVCAGVLIVIASVVITVLSMTCASRIKSQALFKYNITTYVCRWLGRVGHAALRLLRRAVMAIPIIWRTLFAAVAIAFVSLILIIMTFATSAPFFLLIMIMFWVGIIVLVCYNAYCLHRLRQAGKRLASGDLAYRIDTTLLYGDYKQHADDLNNIGDGMTAAVEERMKSERFKAELITNVSHDIKTPLTSIINYIDLLKQCDIEGETERSYIDTLDRHSQKLRRLTEDLIEASKASSGVLPVSLSLCDLSVLVSQAAGEYEERLAAAGLTLIVKKPNSPVNVMADGRHTARIFDNLMSNVLKYSLTGTRVYLDLKISGAYAGISLCNISRDPIDADGDELTERFVRGDTSRHTDGSGLGLSIAKSLAELQDCTLEVEAVSDLFRATVWFRIVE